jgi:hypothetical protein
LGRKEGNNESASAITLNLGNEIARENKVAMFL